MTKLQELLNLGLIDIGSDDSRFTKIKGASKALVDKLETKPGLIIPATLISIDCDVVEQDQFLEIVEKLVIDKWKTMRNIHTNRPRELLRAIIIDALGQAAKNNPEIASAIWQTAISPFNHNQAKLGKEAELVKRLLQDIGDYAEQEAIARLSQTIPTTIKKPRKKTIFKPQPAPNIQDTELIKDVGRSAGPQDKEGEAYKDPNPHWPNVGEEWSDEFTPRMTSALVKAVNLGLTQMSDKYSSSMKYFIELFEKQQIDYLKEINTTQTEIINSSQSDRMRLEVLWWFEAKYSSALKCGYRELPEVNASMAMAFDLSDIVPPLAPASVTYILGEVATSLFQQDKATYQQSVKDYLKNLNNNGSGLRNIVPKVSVNGMRQPLLELTLEAINGVQIKLKDLQTRTGINPSLKLTLPQFAVWIFRDIQARRLVEEIK